MQRSTPRRDAILKKEHGAARTQVLMVQKNEIGSPFIPTDLAVVLALKPLSQESSDGLQFLNL